jgi:hypothetical protein
VQIPSDVRKRLNAFTLMYVAKELERKADTLLEMSRDGLLGAADNAVQARIEILQALSTTYVVLAQEVTNEERQHLAPMPDTPAKKRPRDFMSQAVSFVLDARTGPQGADEILKRILGTPSIMQMLPRRPEKSHVAETLSAGSRGSNPRFIRVKMGLYKNNPSYKKAK